MSHSCLWPFSPAKKSPSLSSEGLIVPYTKIGPRDFPMIDLAISHNFQIIKIRALVDTGASLSLFRPEIASYLGLVIDRGRKISLDAVSSELTGYVHDLKVKIADQKLTLPVAFLVQPHTSFNILGRDIFFSNFLITFDEGNKVVRLKPN